MAKHRQFLPLGTNPVYDKYYDIYHRQSQCLTVHTEITPYTLNLNDEKGLKNYRMALVGVEKDGSFWAPDEKIWKIAHIPYFNGLLKGLETRFLQYQTMRVKEGRKKPTEYTPDMMEKRWEYEAARDVALTELDWINARLEKFAEAKATIKNRRMLQFGAVGTAVMKGGVIAEIDGQACGYVPDGNNEEVLVIIEDGSPYRGMMVSTYRDEIVKPYRAAKEKAFAYNEAIKMEARKNGGIPDESKFVSIRPQLPPFPKDEKNYLPKVEKPVEKYSNGRIKKIKSSV